VFGPIDLESLKSWVRDGRVEPLAGVSSDLEHWILAPLMPELEMNWVVENNPGQFYGPTHRAVVDDLEKSGTLSPAARFYQDDRGAARERIASLEAALADRDAELARKDEQIAARDAEVASLRGQLAKRDEVHAREWKTDVVVPEVVVNEMPPPVARQAFAPSSFADGAPAAVLADLERRAQQELARMGATGAKKFFRFKK